MAIDAYTALRATTLTDVASSVILDVSGITGYTDLIVVGDISMESPSGTAYIIGQVGNGSVDTNTNYSFTVFYGNGSSPVSYRDTSKTYFQCDTYLTGSNRAMFQMNFLSYSNTSVYKKFIGRTSSGATNGSVYVNLWRSTSAIDKIKFYDYSGNNFAAGSTFTVYGIKAETANAVASSVSGGTLYSDSSYYYRVFTSSDSLNVTGGVLTADILLVGGGGGGGSNQGGGGGAGGMYTLSSQKLLAGTHTVVIGAGGVGSSINSPNNGTNGNNTIVSAFTPAYGGGRGGTYSVVASNGGSGGGGSGGTNTAGTGVSGQGNSGGTGGWYGAGGGGKGAAGANAVTQNNAVPGATDGGIGATSSISGGSVTAAGQESSGSYYFAGGGGGGSTASNAGGAPGNGGLGGGGRGQAQNYNLPAIAGTANTGGGGGGGNQGGQGYNPLGAAGGSGIVIVRYAK